MGRASWAPGKSLDFIPRLAGASFPGPSVHMALAAEQVEIKGRSFPFPGFFPKWLLQGQKALDSRTYLLPHTKAGHRTRTRAIGEAGVGGIGPRASERPSKPTSWGSLSQGFFKVCRRQQPWPAGEPPCPPVWCGVPGWKNMERCGHWHVLAQASDSKAENNSGFQTVWRYLRDTYQQEIRSIVITSLGSAVSVPSTSVQDFT